MKIFSINSEGEAVAESGMLRCDILEMYKGDCSKRVMARLINDVAPECRKQRFIPRPALQKVVDAMGYVCNADKWEVR